MEEPERSQIIFWMKVGIGVLIAIMWAYPLFDLGKFRSRNVTSKLSGFIVYSTWVVVTVLMLRIMSLDG